MKKLLFILATVLVFASCVHQWPEEEVDPTLINVSIILHQADTITLYDNGNPWVETHIATDDSLADLYKNDDNRYDKRFIVELYYNDDFDHSLIERRIVMRNATDTADVILNYNLHARNYQILAWQDFTYKDSENDLFYSTQDLTKIHVLDKESYVGANDYKQVQSKSLEFSLLDCKDEWFANRSIDVQLERPVAKIVFVTTDLEKFVYNWLTKRKIPRVHDIFENITSSEYLDFVSGMHVVFSYDGYLPTGFNVLTNKPNDSQLEFGYECVPYYINSKQVIMAFDYILINSHDTSIKIKMDIYDASWKHINSVANIEVPLSRNKMTVVMDKFLTKSFEPGIGLDPNYDGEFNIYFLRKRLK